MNYIPSKSPAPKAGQDKPASTEAKKKDRELIARQDAALPKAGPDPKFTMPVIEKAKLSNGLDLWVVQHHELPIVSMNLVLNAGGILENAEKSGVASMTSNMLNQGTKTRSAVEIANALQSIGSQVNPSASWDSSNISVLTLTRNLDQTLDIFSDMVVNPIFPGEGVRAAETTGNGRLSTAAFESDSGCRRRVRQGALRQSGVRPPAYRR
jgi:zinc protease